MELPTEYSEIGRLLWSIFPEDAESIIYRGHLFPDYNEKTVKWFYPDGRSGSFDFNRVPSLILNEIIDQLIQIQKSALFEKEPFTHFKATIDNRGKLHVDYAYVEQDNSWPGLYMRGVSELSLEEARAHYIPEKEWEERVKKYGKKDDETESSDIT